MAILRVARMGNPVLRRTADRVSAEELATEEIQGLIDDMLDTVGDYGGAGLAAPQVHISKQVAVICPPAEEDGSEAGVPAIVLVNPVIEPLGEEMETGWEGCLSVPEIRGQVRRPRAVQVTAMDRRGEPIRFRAEGRAATIVQHEVDHLAGVLYLDRMEGLQSLCFLTEYARYVAE